MFEVYLKLKDTKDYRIYIHDGESLRYCYVFSNEKIPLSWDTSIIQRDYLKGLTKTSYECIGTVKTLEEVLPLVKLTRMLLVQ